MCGPKFCSMEITQQLREYADQRELSEEQAAEQGMAEKSAEFRERREIYVPADAEGERR